MLFISCPSGNDFRDALILSPALVVDMITRHLQDRVRKAGLPWVGCERFRHVYSNGVGLYPSLVEYCMLNPTSGVQNLHSESFNKGCIRPPVVA